MEETKYTKSEIIDLVKTELIKIFGGLSQDENGELLETPYMVLGILYESIPTSYK